MKYTTTITSILAAAAIDASAAFLTVKVDAQTPNQQIVLDRVFSGNTPLFKVLFYDNGTPYSLTNWTTFFRYSYGKYDTNGMATIVGSNGSNTVTSGDTSTTYYNAATFTGTSFFEPGDYYISIYATNSDGRKRTWATGTMREDYDPAAGTSIAALTSRPVNWDNVVSVGKLQGITISNVILEAASGVVTTESDPVWSANTNQYATLVLATNIALAVSGGGPTGGVNAAQVLILSSTNPVNFATNAMTASSADTATTAGSASTADMASEANHAQTAGTADYASYPFAGSEASWRTALGLTTDNVGLSVASYMVRRESLTSYVVVEGAAKTAVLRTNDFSAAMQHALNLCPPAGLVEIGANISDGAGGTLDYEMSNTVTIAKAVHIRGQGNPGTTISPCTTNDLFIFGATNFVSGIARVESIRFDGLGRTTLSNQSAIVFKNVYEPNLYACEFTYFNGPMVRYEGTNGYEWASVARCWFVGYTNSSTALWFNHTAGIGREQNIIGNLFLLGGDGIRVEPLATNNAMTITGNRFIPRYIAPYNTSSAIRVRGAGSGHVIAGNTFGYQWYVVPPIIFDPVSSNQYDSVVSHNSFPKWTYSASRSKLLCRVGPLAHSVDVQWNRVGEGMVSGTNEGANVGGSIVEVAQVAPWAAATTGAFVRVGAPVGTASNALQLGGIAAASYQTNGAPGVSVWTNGTTGWFDGKLSGTNGVFFTIAGTNYWILAP